MTSKRQLKKFINNSCGEFAEALLAVYPVVSEESIDSILTDIARLQADTLAKVSISFDKTARDFENRAEYNKARRTYFSTAYRALLEKFYDEAAEVVGKMNAALPAEVKAGIKNAAE